MDKKEDLAVNTLSSFFQMGSVDRRCSERLKRIIQRLKHSVNNRHEPIVCDPEVVIDVPVTMITCF